MGQRLRTILAALPGLVILAVFFPLPFYFGCGVCQRCDGPWLWLQGAAALGVALVAVWVTVRLGGGQSGGAATPSPRELQRQFDAQRAAQAQVVAELRGHPLLSHWAPLVAQRMWVDRRQVDEWEVRYRQLLADPYRRWAAERMLAGAFLTDLQIDYEGDPALLVTCPHLQPLERALRDAGVKMGPRMALHVYAHAAIDFARVQRDFALPSFVVQHWTAPHPHQAEEELVFCQACRSSIDVLGGEPFPRG